jgi:hypothetical protein
MLFWGAIYFGEQPASKTKPTTNTSTTTIDQPIFHQINHLQQIIATHIITENSFLKSTYNQKGIYVGARCDEGAGK